MKKIAQMKKDELIELALSRDVEIDDDMTKEEIKNAIQDAGITDENLEEEKQEAPERGKPAETEDEVLVRMVQNVNHYQYGSYVFTKANPFEIMKKEDAERLVEDNPTQFKKASEAEIRSHFK